MAGTGKVLTWRFLYRRFSRKASGTALLVPNVMFVDRQCRDSSRHVHRLSTVAQHAPLDDHAGARGGALSCMVSLIALGGLTLELDSQN